MIIHLLGNSRTPMNVHSRCSKYGRESNTLSLKKKKRITKLDVSFLSLYLTINHAINSMYIYIIYIMEIMLKSNIFFLSTTIYLT